MEISLKNNRDYLIQRVDRHYSDEFKEHKKGIDYFVEFDYMGSAEYEFGAIPKSWKFMKENASQYKLITVPMVLSGISFNMFCIVPKDTESSYMIDLFKKLHDHTHYTKENARVSFIDEMISKESDQVGWFNLKDSFCTRDEIPWFATVSPSIAFYWYKEMHMTEERRARQEELFNNVRIGDMVIYPTYKENLYSIGKVIGSNEEGVTVKSYNRRRRYKANQIIFLEEGKSSPEFDLVVEQAN